VGGQRFPLSHSHVEVCPPSQAFSQSSRALVLSWHTPWPLLYMPPRLAQPCMFLQSTYKTSIVGEALLFAIESVVCSQQTRS
jgi:hypothetical protein